MNPTSSETAAGDGMWPNSPMLLQLLGISPLLAVTTSAVNGLALGLATAAVLLVTSVVMSFVHGAAVPAWRVPLFALVAAALVTAIDLVSSAFFDALHESLGIFIALVVPSCALIAHASVAAPRRGVLESALASVAAGLGALGLLVILGALRELLGHGSLLAGMPMLFGERAAGLTVDLHISGMLIAVLPPGAFLSMAALLAVRARMRKTPTEAAP